MLHSLVHGPARFTQLVPNSYVTDGRRLLRVVSRIEAGGESVFASLEDCATLEVRPYSPGELAALRLRPVPRAGVLA